MKILITIVVVAVLGYLFFAYSSKAPEGVERATVTEDTSGASGVATTVTTTTTTSTTTDANAASTSTTSTAPTASSTNAAGTSRTINTGASLNISSKYKVEDFTFTFTGYGPGGKTETGTFKKMTVSDIATDAKGNPTSGKLTIDTSTVSTGKAGLDKHLCTDDFFNCTKYPSIVFTYKSIVFKSATKATVTGALEYNGAKKDVSFDVNVDAGKLSASADFLLDTTPFKFKYTGVNKDVRIQFGFKVAEAN
jgi:polyisoprenoid-binding protein YceI